MTQVPTVTSAVEAHQALGRCRRLVEDRVDPIVGLELAAVQDWITSSHPGVILEGSASTIGWPSVSAFACTAMINERRGA